MARAKPKLDWLDAAKEAINQDPDYRKLGSTDVVLGLAIGDETRLVRFEAFEVAGIEADVDLRDASLVLRMNPKDWNAYLKQRSKGKGESLLTLDLAADAAKTIPPPPQSLTLVTPKRCISRW